MVQRMSWESVYHRVCPAKYNRSPPVQPTAGCLSRLRSRLSLAETALLSKALVEEVKAMILIDIFQLMVLIGSKS